MPDPRLERPYWRGRTNVDAITINGIERAERLGTHVFTVTQGSYQSGSGEPLSAGTHDLGGVVDLRWCGHTSCILALRKAGFAAWHRTPAQGPWPDHIHAVGIGHPYLAPVAARQVESYRSGRNGLASNGADDGPRIDPIPPLQWPPEDDDMPLNDDDKKWIRDTIRAELEKHDDLGEPINEHEAKDDKFKGKSVRSVLKAIARKTGAV